MAAMWSQLGALGAPRPGCHSQHGAAWPPIQCLWSEQISVKKIENVESAAAAQQSNARIAKTNRRSRFGEALSTFSVEEEEEGGSALLSELIAAVSFCFLLHKFSLLISLPHSLGFCASVLHSLFSDHVQSCIFCCFICGLLFYFC